MVLGPDEARPLPSNVHVSFNGDAPTMYHTFFYPPVPTAVDPEIEVQEQEPGAEADPRGRPYVEMEPEW